MDTKYFSCYPVDGWKMSSYFDFHLPTFPDQLYLCSKLISPRLESFKIILNTLDGFQVKLKLRIVMKSDGSQVKDPVVFCPLNNIGSLIWQYSTCEIGSETISSENR